MSGWWLAGLAVMALGPASAQVEPSRVTSPSVKSSVSPKAKPGTVVPIQATAAQVSSYAPQANTAQTGFEAYKNWLMHRARQEGVREDTIRAYIPTLNLDSRAMQLDRAQRPSSSGGSNTISPLAPYIREHVTPSLITRGRSRYSSYWPQLSQIYTRYGVDPAVLMAIYGKETSYGSITGSFDLLEALASLAYEGRRRQMFETEFLSTLKLIEAGVPRWRLKGSYAGATGYPQFMPSVVLRLRADGDGDGFADIWNNEVDALASIANYLRDAGWKPGVRWGSAARVAPTLDRAAIRSTLQPDRCPAVFRRHSRWMTVGEWRTIGVVPYDTSLPNSEMATLMEPDGPGATAYLLTNNYRAVLEYNCSNFYAMSVVLLADAIARR